MSARISIALSKETIKSLDTICSRWGCNRSSLVSIIIGQYLDSFDNEEFLKSFDRLSKLKELEYLDKLNK